MTDLFALLITVVEAIILLIFFCLSLDFAKKYFTDKVSKICGILGYLVGFDVLFIIIILKISLISRILLVTIVAILWGISGGLILKATHD